MKNAKVIVGYSRALFEVAQELQKEEVFLQELESLLPLLQEEIIAFNENPAFTDSEKQEVMQACAQKLKLSGSMTAFLVLLAQHGRLRYVQQIINFYRKLFYQAQGKELMTLVSAVELSKKEQEKIHKAFSALKALPLEIETKVDTNLLGGALVQIGSTVWDGSIRGRLNQLKRELLAGS